MKSLFVFLCCIAITMAKPASLNQFMEMLDDLKDISDTLKFKSSMRRLIPTGLRMVDFSYSDCGKASDLAHLNSLSIGPDPIKIPGVVNLAASLSIVADLNKPIHASIELKKKVTFFWVDIPCIDNLGSCSYPDICTKLPHKTCPSFLIKNKIPCYCPFLKGTYNLPSTSVGINPKLPSFLTTGEYKGSVSLTMDGKPVLCIDASFSLD